MGHGGEGAEQALGVDGTFAVEVSLAHEPAVDAAEQVRLIGGIAVAIVKQKGKQY